MQRSDQDPRVPYALLEAGVAQARAAFPDATAHRALWTPSSSECEVHVEVWERSSAVVWRPSL